MFAVIRRSDRMAKAFLSGGASFANAGIPAIPDVTFVERQIQCRSGQVPDSMA